MHARIAAYLIALCAALPAPGQTAAADERARVNALADRFVAEYRTRFPISYAFSGLPIERHDGVDINSPA